MARFVLLAALSLLSISCAYDSVTGPPYRPPMKFNPPDTEYDDEKPHSLEHLMAVERYAHDHNGKLPPPDAPIYPW